LKDGYVAGHLYFGGVGRLVLRRFAFSGRAGHDTRVWRDEYCEHGARKFLCARRLHGRHAGIWATAHGASPAWSLLILPLAAIIVGCVFGALMETSLMQHIYNKDPILQLLITFSAFMIFEDLQRLVWGTQPYFVSDIVNYLGTADILGITYTRYQLMVVPGVALVVFVALRSFLKLQQHGSPDRRRIA
jgi:hypothetical protein